MRITQCFLPHSPPGMLPATGPTCTYLLPTTTGTHPPTALTCGYVVGAAYSLTRCETAAGQAVPPRFTPQPRSLSPARQHYQLSSTHFRVGCGGVPHLPEAAVRRLALPYTTMSSCLIRGLTPHFRVGGGVAGRRVPHLPEAVRRGGGGPRARQLPAPA